MNLTAKEGGAIYFDRQNDNSVIERNKFLNWTAYQGGAIYNSDQKIFLVDDVFTNNTAINQASSDGNIIYGDGGAVYNLWNINDDCISNYTNNHFDGN